MTQVHHVGSAGAQVDRTEIHPVMPKHVLLPTRNTGAEVVTQLLSPSTGRCVGRRIVHCEKQREFDLTRPESWREGGDPRVRVRHWGK